MSQDERLDNQQMTMLRQLRFLPSLTGLQRCPFRQGTSVAIVLLKDLPGRGNAGDIIQVKRGFARNLLIPRKTAVYATRDNRVQFARRELVEKEVREDESHKLLAGDIVTLSRAVDAKGFFFDRIAVADISHHLRLTMGKSPNRIFLPSPVTRPGRYPAIVDGAEIVINAVIS